MMSEVVGSWRRLSGDLALGFRVGVGWRPRTARACCLAPPERNPLEPITVLTDKPTIDRRKGDGPRGGEPSNIGRVAVKRKAVAVVVALLASMAGLFLEASPASALVVNSRYDCRINIVSTGSPGGGIGGICYNWGGWIQTVGLCVNNFTRASRFVEGPWVKNSMSVARCSWSERPYSSNGEPSGWVRIGSA